MTILIVGLALFIGIHLVPVFGGMRQNLVSRLGENRYKGLYSLAAIAGLGLTIWGYGLVRFSQPILWNPLEWVPLLAAVLMLIALVLLVAAYIPGKIKQAVRHPMITAVGLWGFAHLLANGGLADLLLFGGFLVWAIIGRVSMGAREAAGSITVESGPVRNDVIAIAVGTLLFGALIWFAHEMMTGLPPLIL